MKSVTPINYELLDIDAPLAMRMRECEERLRIKRHRYECKNRAKRAKDRHRHRSETYLPEFVMWDGESPKDTGYSLFGSSKGHEICHPRLGTEECFDILLRAKRESPNDIHVMFGSRYDFDEICRADMPTDRLGMLKWNGHVYWHGYRLEQAEGKFFKISKGGITVTIYEISSWFHVKYIVALRKYGIGTDLCEHGQKYCTERCNCVCDLCTIEYEKERRGDFTWAEIKEITKYMRLELKFGPQLMNSIRKMCHDAGFRPRRWYGPSALAMEALGKNNVYRYMAECPTAVNRASQFAYVAGRFEMVRGGIIGHGFTYDLNSAYMWAALDLPDLLNGEWRHTDGLYESGKFALYHIRYIDKDGTNPSNIHPLFRRYKNGNVRWVPRVEGWYWSPEAELVKDNPNAEFLEAWIYDENSSTRPFAFVRGMFHARLVLQRLSPNNPSRAAEKALKWALAAIYGQLARRVGWDRKRKRAPRTHQLEWAGYITSKCRAAVFKAALQAGDKLISIDTDSVTAMCSLNLELGEELGQWSLKEFDLGYFFQSGVYATQSNNEWHDSKTRGMEKKAGTSGLSPDILKHAILAGKPIKVLPKRYYTTVRMALAQNMNAIGQWREKALTLSFGGDGKRYHNAKMCSLHCSDNVHLFLPTPTLSPNAFFDYHSYPHPLPWKPEKRKIQTPIDSELAADIFWFDPERIDNDDQWLIQIAGEKKSALHTAVS